MDLAGNALEALARVAAHYGASFTYYTKTVPGWLRAQPNGNYATALALGAHVVELPPAEYAAAFGDVPARPGEHACCLGFDQQSCGAMDSMARPCAMPAPPVSKISENAFNSFKLCVRCVWIRAICHVQLHRDVSHHP